MPDPRIQVTLDGRRLDDQVLGLLTRLEVRESDADPTVAALRFNLVQTSSGNFTPLDDDLFRPATQLALDVEAPGGNPARLFEGHLTHVRPHFETIESNSYVELIAMDAAALLDAEERVETYPDMTDSEAVEQVFRRYKIPVSADATDARHEADKRLLVQRETDWSFVRRLARRNGFACYFEPDAATGRVSGHFKRRAVGDNRQADLTILRENPNLRWIDLQFAMSGPTRYAGATIDPIAKRLLRADGAPALRPLGEELLDAAVRDGLSSSGATGSTALLRDPAELDAALAAQATAETDRSLFAVVARGELDPSLYRGLLRARRPVLVKGVGSTFTGAYYVRAVRTTFQEGALAQTFVAERNAIGLGQREAFGQTAEEVPPP